MLLLGSNGLDLYLLCFLYDGQILLKGDLADEPEYALNGLLEASAHKISKLMS